MPSGLVGARKLARLWQPVATCGGQFQICRTPLVKLHSRKLHSTEKVDGSLQAGRLQGIAVMDDWRLQN